MSLAKLVLRIDGQDVKEYDLNESDIADSYTALMRILEYTIYQTDAVALGWLAKLVNDIRQTWSHLP